MAGDTQPQKDLKKRDWGVKAASYQEYHKDFIKEFGALAPHKHRYEVFRDFVTFCAISLSNSILINDEREAEYHQIRKTYKAEHMEVFPKLLGLLVNMLDFAPRDVLGELYMELEISSKDKGQFFTPSHVSDLMSEITYGDELRNSHKPFITLSEPACGAGGMVLSFVKTMLAAGQNPAQKLWVQCIDIDRLPALMCYVQLSLWHVPAEVLVGDTLRWDIREVWYTPSHHLGNWNYKLRNQSETKAVETERSSDAPTRTETNIKPEQFDFGF